MLKGTFATGIKYICALLLCLLLGGCDSPLDYEIFTLKTNVAQSIEWLNYSFLDSVKEAGIPNPMNLTFLAIGILSLGLSNRMK
jgi:hypothetical protein